MRISHLVYPIVQPILRSLRRSPLLIRKIFDVRVPPDVAVQYDPTTVLLARTMQDLVAQTLSSRGNEPPLRLLEMGIGQGALVSLSIAAQTQPEAVRIDGVDCSPSRVNSSREVASFNGRDAHFWQSDLFTDVSPESQYDFIFFNPPYVPTQTGRDLQLTQRLEVDGDQMWDGGEDGASVLREFLDQSREYLSPGGCVVFGVQEIFLPDALVRKTMEPFEYQRIERQRPRWLPSTAYIGYRPTP
ncbi:methyltransferase [Rhodopirellula sallentina]|uniref:Protein-(Glutamine-N5) methyltransferase, release factor-specific n=1 Tax=Rhodopirellula sallentina SM41 TaxID=1263870 RepID=M5TSQ7_9BACT|nr:methyltransferase [Rhodopirellula sallentina]EMI52099.1 protein-(glutamine-N5) methyltransferase, release factor-specific [Rhodopirellula sallentina SM41]